MPSDPSTMRAQGRVWALLAVALTLLAVGQYQRHVELLQPSQAVKHQEELDEDHQILQSEEESEGIYKHWNAAHNDEIRGDNIGEIHPSSAWHHELFSKAKPVKKIRKHAKVIKDPSDPANNVKFFPLRWMQQQDDPAVKTRGEQGLARTTKLWNAAENDKVGLYNDPVSSTIAHYQSVADDQGLPGSVDTQLGSKPATGIYKSARTQKLFIVPQANVLSGAGQEKKTATGAENVDAEKAAEAAGAAKLEATAEKAPAKKARMQKLWNAAEHDAVLKLERPAKWTAAPVNAAIAGWQARADDQTSKTNMFSQASGLTQKLFIVPQANVLTGQGQEVTSATGHEDMAAEKKKEAAGAALIVSKAAKKGAARIVSKAAKKAALEKKKEAAKAQKLDAAPYMRPMPRPFGKDAAPLNVGHPQPYDRGEVRPLGAKQVAAGGSAEFGQSGMSLAEVRAVDAKQKLKSKSGRSRRRVEVEGKTFEVKSKTQALWNAAKESRESKAMKAQHTQTFGVPLKGAYRGYRASRQRNYLPADYHAPGAEDRGKARQQSLWNAATPESRYWRPKPKPRFGVPLNGAYRGYEESEQVSYLPADFHGQEDQARTQQLWDAAENDSSLESTRESLGMATSRPRGKAADLSGQPRNYLTGCKTSSTHGSHL